jgi:hypothetical protein
MAAHMADVHGAHMEDGRHIHHHMKISYWDHTIIEERSTDASMNEEKNKSKDGKNDE